MVTTIKEIAYVNTSGWMDLVNPNSSGADGKGALRGIRLQRFHNSGLQASGTFRMALTIDGRLLASGIIGDNTALIPYGPGLVQFTPTGQGMYLRLGQWVMGADYHENILISGNSAVCACLNGLNSQRVPHHLKLRIQGEYFDCTQASGIRVDTWYELKGS